jgi:hypothetical protein
MQLGRVPQAGLGKEGKNRESRIRLAQQGRQRNAIVAGAGERSGELGPAADFRRRVSSAPSGQDLYRRAVVHQFPDFVDFLVGDGDASVGPIVQAMRSTEVPIPVQDPVDHNVAAG